jgi:hypothetical protein
MVDLVLMKTRIQAGVWEGVLMARSGDAYQPDLSVSHLEQELANVAITPLADQAHHWMVQIPIPADLLTDGIQTIVISDRSTGETLNTFAILTGKPLEDDIRPEVDLLRAELDMLKRAFRRHCLETLG